MPRIKRAPATKAVATPSANNKQNGQVETNFFSSGLRQKVDQLMDILWSGGVNNPMASVEQISYLLFIRLLSEQDEQFSLLDGKYKRIFSGSWSKCAWGNFVTLAGDELFNAVRDAIERLHELPGLSETGRLLFSRATLKIYDRPTLRAVVQGVHNLDLVAQDGHDVKGDMYEYLLSKLSAAGTNGQFRTPRHIIKMIVSLVDPQPNQRICDPACGTAGFLVWAFNHILEKNTKPADLKRGAVDGSGLKPAQWKFLEEQAFTGFDNDAEMIKIAILNLYLHRLEKAQVSLMNPLTTGFGGAYPGRQYDVILANPPFAGKIQEESILADLNYKLNTRATELLFLKWFIDHLAKGGRAGVIVPNGVLFGSNNAAMNVRELLLTECDLQAVISLPSGVFKPYSGVGTAVLVFEKGKKTQSVWFYDLTADGFSLDDKRVPIETNDIPDLLAQWPSREEGPNSYCVPIEKIKENDWSLAIGRYRPITTEVIKHDAPEKILVEILKNENEIMKRGSALLTQLSKQKMKHWPIRLLGEVSDCVMGQAPPGHECNFEGEGTPFVKAGEFGAIRPVIREWTTKPLKLAKSSDVLICVVGATCGKLNLGADCAIGRSVAAIRPKSDTLDQKYLHEFLQGWTLRLRSCSQGSAQSVITKDMLDRIPVPLPPLAEQKRIATLLDEAGELRKLCAQSDCLTTSLIPALFHKG